jgi:hypothetical protein
MPTNKNRNKQQKAIVKIDGKGNYYTEKIVPVMQQIVPRGSFAKGGSYLGGAAGALAGGRYGMGIPGSAIGGKLGGFLGKGMSRILGFGDYTVTHNSLVKEGMAIAPGEAVPAFGVIGHATRVRHREYIGDIVIPSSPTEFVSSSYTINPGNSTTFPWLSALAANYQQYRFEGLVFEFKTLSSDITAGGALGSLMLATNYDVLESPYADKVHLENSQYAVSAKPSQSQIHTIECDPAASTQNLWYVRDSSSSTSTGDDRFYDLGKFQVATAGLPGTEGSVLGELWASYDVSLFKPEIVTQSNLSSKIVSTGSVSKTVPFGTNPVTTGTSVSTVDTDTITFTRSGEYLVEIDVTGTGASSITQGGSATVDELADGVTSTTGRTKVYRVSATSGQTLSFAFGAWTTVTAANTRITDFVYSLD